MSKILFYSMTVDSGFAPNPFWGYLTLATCTPNHMRADLKKDDWIVGVESKSMAQERKKAGLKPNIEQCLIYIAKLTEDPIDLPTYFKDIRFKNKKYNTQNCITREGDNVYYIENGMWKWIRGHVHDSGSIPFFKEKDLNILWETQREDYGAILQDIRGNKVFISEYFSYFGDKCVPVPEEIIPCIPQRGIKYCHDNNNDCNCKQITHILETLIKKYGKGRLGNPILHTIKKLKKINCNKIPKCKG